MRIRVFALVAVAKSLEDTDFDYTSSNTTNYDFYDPFRSYCSEYTQTDTSTFLPFGSSAWPGHGDGIRSNWVDDRDEWILEADDIYKQVDFKSNFGGQYMRYMCISSNGPVYIERSTTRCRSGAPDFNPQHISATVDPENRWTGVSAFWSDFLQASDSGQNGGNVYYREVSVNDLDYRSTLDLIRAANNMLTEEFLERIHVITFHKMADINGKRGCDTQCAIN